MKSFYEIFFILDEENIYNFLLSKKSYSNKTLAFLLEQHKDDRFDLGDFLIEYNNFTQKNINFIVKYIKNNLLNTTLTPLYRSDLLDFATLWSLTNFEEEAITILSNEEEDEIVSICCIQYLGRIITMYNFPNYYNLLNIILDGAYYGNVKLNAGLILLKFTNDMKYVDVIREIINEDKIFLSRCLSNTLEARYNQPEYYALYSTLSALID